MPKATEQNTTNRRAFLGTIAAAIPATAIATGSVVTLAAAAEADPIFAAIDAHAEAVANVRKVHARLVAAGREMEWLPVHDAIEVQCAAAKVLQETAPTTRSGRLALAQYAPQLVA